MTFLENVEQMCRLRGESVSHALEAAGIDKSLYPKWRKNGKNFIPRGTTVQRLADYFGCSFHDLEPHGKKPSEYEDSYVALTTVLKNLNAYDLDKVLAYVLFTYGEELPDEMQKLRKNNRR